MRENSNSLIEIQNVQEGIRNITNKENNIKKVILKINWLKMFY